jgi:hypothetical protein
MPTWHVTKKYGVNKLIPMFLAERREPSGIVTPDGLRHSSIAAPDGLRHSSIAAPDGLRHSAINE